jgi:SNF2 family DNA or RNA helicase
MPKRDFLEWRAHMDAATKEVYLMMAWDLLEALEAAQARGEGFNVMAHYAGRKVDETTPVGKVMAIHMAMEMLLDHPDVVFASGMACLEDEDGDSGSQYAAQLCEDDVFLELTHSPKLTYLTYRLGLLMEQTHSKVIIFTRYRRMQEIIAATCQEYGWDAVEYHGELNTAEQQAARARFLNSQDCRVFISTHAGERGTDLPVANWLVNIEPVWSSGQADQINGRHMRTSSEFDDIYVADMFVAGSIEERKLDQQAQKRKVAAAVVDGIMPKDGKIKNDVESLTQHLRAWLTQNDPDGMVLHEAADMAAEIGQDS